MAIIQSARAYSGATRPTVRVAGRSFSANSSEEAQRRAAEYIAKRRSTPRVNTRKARAEGDRFQKEIESDPFGQVFNETLGIVTGRPTDERDTLEWDNLADVDPAGVIQEQNRQAGINTPIAAPVPRPASEGMPAPRPTAPAVSAAPRPAPSPENPLGLNLSNLELMRRRAGLSGGSGSSVRDKQVQAQIAEERRLAEAERVRTANATAQEQALGAQQNALESQLQGAQNVAAIEAGGKIGAAQATANAKIEEAKLTIQAKTDDLIAQGLAVDTPEFRQKMAAELGADLARAEQAGDIERENTILRAQLENQKGAGATIERFSGPTGTETTTTIVKPNELKIPPQTGRETPIGVTEQDTAQMPTEMIPDSDIANLDGEEGISEKDRKIQSINNMLVRGTRPDGSRLTKKVVDELLQRLKELRAVKPIG